MSFLSVAPFLPRSALFERLAKRFWRRICASTGSALICTVILSACAPQPIELRQTFDDSSLTLVDSLTSKEFDRYAVKTLEGVDFSQYQSVMITPVTLRIPENEWQSLTDEDRRRLYRYFQSAFRAAFDDLALTNSPDDTTLIVNTYITKVVPSDPERNFAPFIIGELDLGAASFESEALDSNGQLVATARGTYNGKPLIEGYSTWDVVKHAVNEWLLNVRQLLKQGEII